MNQSTKTPAPRHEAQCSICSHPSRDEIDHEFCEWKPLTIISRERKLSRAALYRHAHATGLFPKRNENIKSALARIIERGYSVTVTAASLVAAIQAYAKIDAAGQWVDKVEQMDVTGTGELFSKMTRAEMLHYAQTGELPAWAPENLRWPTEDVSE